MGRRQRGGCVKRLEGLVDAGAILDERCHAEMDVPERSAALSRERDLFDDLLRAPRLGACVDPAGEETGKDMAAAGILAHPRVEEDFEGPRRIRRVPVEPRCE